MAGFPGILSLSSPDFRLPDGRPDGILPVMLRLTLALALMTIPGAQAQVRIHDAAVRLLAKPFGIEKRIELQSIDALHCAEDGSKRLVFTLRSSGVKEVVLKQPEFSLDIVLPDGSWASLGILSGSTITFPLTGKTVKKSRTYVADFKSTLTRSDIEAYLRQAAGSDAGIRLLGDAEMRVNSNGKTEFSKKDLRLELGGRTTLSGDFRSVQHTSARQLPKVGRR